MNKALSSKTNLSSLALITESSPTIADTELTASLLPSIVEDRTGEFEDDTVAISAINLLELILVTWMS